MKKKIRVLSAVTVSDSLIFFYGMPSFLSEHGFEVAIASSKGPELDMLIEKENPLMFPVEMKREISIFNDLVSLIKVIKIIHNFKPDIVNAGTPKAGLLFILGAWLCRVPVRIYHLRGLRHESLRGFSEKLQITIEKFVGFLATHIICETHSLKELSLKQNLYNKKKCFVLGPGSSGVELENFNPTNFSNSMRLDLREKLGIKSDSTVIGFVGRLVPRKGVSELLESWKVIREKYPGTTLLLVGPMEDAQSLTDADCEIIKNDARIVTTGKIENVAKYYSIMDIFTLPAHWEGFGNVVVEAASMGVPVITTNGTGTKDAAKSGYNSLMINVKDSSALTDAISKYVEDQNLRYEHGKNGIEWAQIFDRKKILMHLSNFYKDIGSN